MRRYGGWEPTTTVRGFDRDGNRVGLNSPDLWETVAEVEPEWDDTSRDMVDAELAYSMSRCPQCGGDPAECSDPSKPPELYAGRHFCWRSAADATFKRRFDWANEGVKPDDAGMYPFDGVSVFATPVKPEGPDADFLDAAPTAPPKN